MSTFLPYTTLVQLNQGTARQPARSGETASFIKHYFEEGELAAWFSQLETLQYTEEMIYDDTHGNPHFHGVARLIGRKPYSSG